MNFWKQSKMIVTNTLFQYEKRRRFMWKRPGDTERYQIDYILVKQRYRNCVKKLRSYPGADANTDHNLVMARIKLRLKKLPRSAKIKRWCLEDLCSKKERFQSSFRRGNSLR